VRLRCETLEGSPAGSYAGRGRPACAREQRRDTVLVELRAVHAQGKARQRFQVNGVRVAALPEAAGLVDGLL
jgi:hypothetical protein